MDAIAEPWRPWRPLAWPVSVALARRHAGL